MPEIMRQFGQTIIVAIAAGLLLTLLFVSWPHGGSVMDEIGSTANGQLEERAVTGTGSVAFDKHSARSLPQVVGKGASVPVGESFILSDKFTITSFDGVWNGATGSFMAGDTRLGGSVHIESIVSSDGTEHVGGLAGDYSTAKVKLSQASGTVQFLEPGVYLVGLRVMDQDNVEAKFTIPLVVDFALND